MQDENKVNVPGVARSGPGTSVASAIAPTVGRMVYYKSRGSADGVYPPLNRAAVVTSVDNTQGPNKWCVTLCVMSPEGLFFTQLLDQGQQPGQWDWMPFQKDQQMRLGYEGKPNSTERSADPSLVYYGPHSCQKCDPFGDKGTLIVKAGNGAPDDLEFDFPRGIKQGIIYPNDRSDLIWIKHQHC